MRIHGGLRKIWRCGFSVDLIGGTGCWEWVDSELGPEVLASGWRSGKDSDDLSGCSRRLPGLRRIDGYFAAVGLAIEFTTRY